MKSKSGTHVDADALLEHIGIDSVIDYYGITELLDCIRDSIGDEVLKAYLQAHEELEKNQSSIYPNS